MSEHGSSDSTSAERGADSDDLKREFSFALMAFGAEVNKYTIHATSETPRKPYCNFDGYKNVMRLYSAALKKAGIE